MFNKFWKSTMVELFKSGLDWIFAQYFQNKKVIENQKNELEQKNEQNKNLQRELETKNNELNEKNQKIINLKRIITERENELEQKNERNRNLKRIITEKNEQIRKLKRIITEKDNELEQKNERNRNLKRIITEKDHEINEKNNEIKEKNQENTNFKTKVTQTNEKLEQKSKTIKSINAKRGINFKEIFIQLEEPKITDPINIDLTENIPQILKIFLKNELLTFENRKNEEKISLEDLNSLKNEIQEIYQKLQKNYNQQLKINPMIFEQNLIRLFKLKQSKPNSKKVVCNENNNLNKIEIENENENENDLENLISEKMKLLEEYSEYLEKIKLKLGNYNEIFFNFEEIKNNLFEEINKNLKINCQIIEGTYNNENVITYIKELNNLEKQKMIEFSQKKNAISKLINLFSNDTNEQMIFADNNELNKMSEKYQNDYVIKVNEIEELKIYIKKIQIIRQRLIPLNETLIKFNQIKEKLNIINLSIQPLIIDIDNNTKLQNRIKGIDKKHRDISKDIRNLRKKISEEEENLEDALDISDNEEQIEKIENGIEKLNNNQKKLIKNKIQNYEKKLVLLFRSFPEQIKKKNISLKQFSKENKYILLKKLQNNTNFKLILTKEFQDINSEKNTIGCSFKILFNCQKNQSIKNSKFHFYLTQINLNSTTDINNLKEIKKVHLSIKSDNSNKKNKTIDIKKIKLDVENYFCFYYYYDNILIGKTVIFKFQKKHINFIYDLEENDEINWKSDSNDQNFQVIYNKKIKVLGPIELPNSSEK
ncbi:DNAj [Anaeramoeba flamelloides]|uniref:DNAj n=1 Tax=Anaeramoeba flamelloides TaxID=1746091 RepID=A0AAV8A5M0_9EUKA|nr:DNAj [Anaeramoeba flamelloides]